MFPASYQVHTRGGGLAAEQEQALRDADPGDVQNIHHRLSNVDDFKTVIFLTSKKKHLTQTKRNIGLTSYLH